MICRVALRYGRLGLADDLLAADGKEVLDHSQAVRAALRWCDQQEGRISGEAPIREPYTVAKAMTDYLDWFRAHRKSVGATELKVTAHILPALGNQEVEKLTIRCAHRRAAGRGRPIPRGAAR